MNNKGERRRFLRAGLDQFLTESLGREVQIARVIDICEGGMRYLLPSEKSTPEGGVVTVEFCLPGEENSIRARARVTNRRRKNTGTETSVSFLAIGGKEAGQIRSWVVARKRAEIFECLRREHLACG